MVYIGIVALHLRDVNLNTTCLWYQLNLIVLDNGLINGCLYLYILVSFLAVRLQ